ncbi:hypothetical protein EV646_10168 [Kribbella antiqua]|uniref:N-acetyltransferase domain-containing protein n=1 Tax=Kribbella antiqua TaxID=2512217 RepID=A0A4R2J2C2_9ACTN|nr:hypothetical protein [Kribbella antiqua]TCO51086.1 hypothetical protein EV646_10168 [Kribbella antiqua]
MSFRIDRVIEERAPGDAGLAVLLGSAFAELVARCAQPEAIALYESSGYVPAAPWGKYVDQPLTRCYAKAL